MDAAASLVFNADIEKLLASLGLLPAPAQAGNSMPWFKQLKADVSKLVAFVKPLMPKVQESYLALVKGVALKKEATCDSIKAEVKLRDRCRSELAVLRGILKTCNEPEEEHMAAASTQPIVATVLRRDLNMLQGRLRAAQTAIGRLHVLLQSSIPLEVRVVVCMCICHD